MATLIELPAELHIPIASHLELCDLLSLRQSCKALYRHEIYREKIRKELRCLDAQTKNAAEKCEKWLPSGSGLLIAIAGYETARNPILVSNWLRHAEQEQVPSIAASWASDRTKMRLYCGSCMAMKLLAAFPYADVRSNRKDHRSVSWKDIRRWNPSCKSKQTNCPTLHAQESGAGQCGDCRISAGYRGWLRLGPFAAEMIIRCETCHRIKRMAGNDPGCTKWLRQGNECYECHIQRPKYREIYRLLEIEEAKFARAEQRLKKARMLLNRQVPPSVEQAKRSIRSRVKRKRIP
ncbi:uncharacterized protein PV07_12783 [Cladophialophora immunda]|uniref:F-box domain-containing protein n=1 Tax=Cladophialophora immunda TaxID=569365 RepID=A0A0D2BRU4_9EURO|nr:uncharacterized protein PV07_12783 [Cladophialophora immunda]KIW21788.1 hypothetical protein PV07_12783 [Cladophialophora immunda]